MISLMSELTESKGRHARGWLFFDGECEFCTRLARLLARSMRRHGLAIAPLQDPRVIALLGLSREELLRSVRFITGDGKQYGGADALLALAQELWWARPIAYMARIPQVKHSLASAYSWGAQRFGCHATCTGIG